MKRWHHDLIEHPAAIGKLHDTTGVQDGPSMMSWYPWILHDGGLCQIEVVFLRIHFQDTTKSAEDLWNDNSINTTHKFALFARVKSPLETRSNHEHGIAWNPIWKVWLHQRTLHCIYRVTFAATLQLIKSASSAFHMLFHGIIAMRTVTLFELGHHKDICRSPKTHVLGWRCQEATWQCSKAGSGQTHVSYTIINFYKGNINTRLCARARVCVCVCAHVQLYDSMWKPMHWDSQLPAQIACWRCVCVCVLTDIFGHRPTDNIVPATR